MGPKYLNETKYVTRNINKIMKQIIKAQISFKKKKAQTL